MNKKELVEVIAFKTGFTQKNSAAFLNAAIEAITERLIKNEPVKMVGFGSFSVTERKPRVGRNPRKPEKTIKIPATKVVTFKPSGDLKEKVNK